jgi:hypothetical protein
VVLKSEEEREVVLESEEDGKVVVESEKEAEVELLDMIRGDQFDNAHR